MEEGEGEMEGRRTLERGKDERRRVRRSRGRKEMRERGKRGGTGG